MGHLDDESLEGIWERIDVIEIEIYLYIFVFIYIYLFILIFIYIYIYFMTRIIGLEFIGGEKLAKQH